MTHKGLIGRIAIGIFGLVAGGLTMTINSWNARAFGLQNATVAALVEHKTFALVDQVIPGFNLVEGTETFRHGAYVYPMKQPGQTILGALVYYPLYKLGINFDNHFDFVSHLITWGSATLLAALSATIIFWLGYSLTQNLQAGIMGSLLFAFGTIVWPYSGVSHHDIQGMSLGLMSVACYYLAQMRGGKQYYLWSGFWAGLTLLFTMLPLTLPIVMGLFCWRRDGFRQARWMALGMLSGILPTLGFNYLLFGNPWLPPNLAGRVSDTMPLWSLPNLLAKLWFYLGTPRTAIWSFSPILIFGVAGLLKLPRRLSWLKNLLFSLMLAQLLHVSSMETHGGYQYGPRYLLTVIPFLAIGLSAWVNKGMIGWWRWVFVALAGYSVVVASLGALQTVMYPMPGPYAPGVFLQQLFGGQRPEWRMFYPGLGLAMAAGAYLYHTYQQNRQKSQ